MASPDIMRDVIAEADMTTPGGMVGALLSIEKTIDQITAIAKLWQTEADNLRAQLLAKMDVLEIATVKHTSGVSVQAKERTATKVVDEDELLASMREMNVLTALTEEVPKHREVKTKLFESWYKEQNYPEQIKGVEIKKTRYIAITNPK